MGNLRISKCGPELIKTGRYTTLVVYTTSVTDMHLSVHYYISRKPSQARSAHGRWQQKEGGGEATWTGEEDGARAFEGDEAMDNLRAHPHEWQL